MVVVVVAVEAMAIMPWWWWFQPVGSPVRSPLGGLWPGAGGRPRNSQYLCCLAPLSVAKCAPAAAIMTALSPVSRPVVPPQLHHQHHQPGDAPREAKRPPEPLVYIHLLPWIYILIRKLVGGPREALRPVMSLFWTPGSFPLCPALYLRPRSADVNQGLTGEKDRRAER